MVGGEDDRAVAGMLLPPGRLGAAPDEEEGPIRQEARRPGTGNCSRSSWIDMYRGLPLAVLRARICESRRGVPSRSGHDPHIPAPVELPFEGAEEMADDVDLKTAIIRFIITGAGSAVLDFWSDHAAAVRIPGGIRRSRRPSVHPRDYNRVPDQPAVDVQGGPSAARFVAVMVLYLVTFAVQVGIYAALEHLWSSDTWLISAASFVIAQGTATVINFVVQRAVIFKLK